MNVEIIKLDPALDRIVPANPKIFKLAEGFKFTEGPLWMHGGTLLVSDPNHNTIYKYTAAGQLAGLRDQVAMPAPISGCMVSPDTTP